MIRTVLKRASAAVLAVMIMCLAVIVSAFSVVAAENKGKITVAVHSDFEGIPLYLIEIGDYTNGKITLSEGFSGLGINFDEIKTSGDMDGAANTVQTFIKSNGLTGVVSWIDTDGNVVFDGVPLDKIYAVVQCAGEEVVKIQPMLFELPKYDNGEVIKEVTAVAKYVDSRSVSLGGAVVVNKLGHENVRLPGAVFEFSQKIYYKDGSKIREGLDIGEDEGGKYYWKPFKQEFVTDSNGQIVIYDLAYATYRFVEIEAPKGYILDPTAHEFDIVKHGSVKVENGRYAAENDGTKELMIYNDIDDSSKTSEDESVTVVESSDTPDDVSGGSDIEGRESVPPDQSEGEASGGVDEDTGNKTEMTGDDIVRYCTTGALVCTSLIVIILLIVIGESRSKKEE